MPLIKLVGAEDEDFKLPGVLGELETDDVSLLVVDNDEGGLCQLTRA